MIKRFWTDLWWLLLFTFVGLVVSMGISYLAMSNASLTVGMHLTQWAQTLFMMLLPPVLWALWYKKEPVGDVLWLKWTNWREMALVGILVLVTLPMMSLVEEWSKTLCEWVLPQSLLSWAEETLAAQEVAYQHLMAVNGVGGWIELILLMCVGTAIGEEAMFRGALLRCMGVTPRALEEGRFSRGSLLWKALCIGFLFAVMHGDVLGLIPRWIMGAAFAGLLFYTRTIWSCVLAHTLNNLCALIQLKGESAWGDETSSYLLATCSLGLTVCVAWLLVIQHRKSKARHDDLLRRSL